MMSEHKAIELAQSFAATTFERPCSVLRATPGLELDDEDRDRRVWNVVFAAQGAREDPASELWVVVDAVSEKARHVRAL